MGDPRLPAQAAKARRRWAPVVLGALLLLCAQNWLMLGPLYLGQAYVPFDFVATYHAVPFFWIEAVRSGVSPAWVPFQAMGYPLYMNAQSGYFYPGFWLFVLLDHSYGYAAAFAFQGLHILLGAVGAGATIRLAGARWSTAVLAAVAYQAFGGFYGNASHPDIARAHALVPWILMPIVARWTWRPALKAAVLALPFWMYCMWTGAYAGVALAVGAAGGLLTVVRTAVAPPGERKVGLSILLAFCAGTAVAAVFLLPVALDRSEVARTVGGHGMSVDYLQLSDLLGLAVRADQTTWFKHDITMRSSSLALPILLLAFLRLCCRDVAKSWLGLLLLAFALAMSTGLLLEPLGKLVPPLAYSRFPISDYRSMVALGLLLLAAQAWECLPDESAARRWAAFAVAAVACTAMVALACWGVYPFAWQWERGAPIALVVAVAEALLLVTWLLLTPALASPVVGAARPQPRTLVWTALVLMVMLDWFRVHAETGYLFGPPATAVAQQQLGAALPDARERLQQRLLNPPRCRPARELIPLSAYVKTPWRGYYTGDYLSHDYAGPMQFARNRQVLADDSLLAFGLLPWRAVEIGQELPAPEDLAQAAPIKGVDCMRYGTDEVRLQVDLERPARIVENELFWPGWTAQAGQASLQAFSVQGFRGWELPAGHYELVARFTPPHQRAAMLAAAGGLLAWVLLSIIVCRTS